MSHVATILVGWLIEGSHSLKAISTICKHHPLCNPWKVAIYIQNFSKSVPDPTAWPENPNHGCNITSVLNFTEVVGGLMEHI